MVMDEIDVVLTSVSAIFTYLASKHYFIPWIIKFWDWLKGEKRDFDKKNVDVSKDLVDFKINTIDQQEKQFQVLLNQITQLEEELQKYANELEKMRTTILRLNSKLYDKSLLIADLQKKSCCVTNCPHRELCKNNLDKIDELDETK